MRVSSTTVGAEWPAFPSCRRLEPELGERAYAVPHRKGLEKLVGGSRKSD